MKNNPKFFAVYQSIDGFSYQTFTKSGDGKTTFQPGLSAPVSTETACVAEAQAKGYVRWVGASENQRQQRTGS
jgi:hypothetical protein